jgi:hypothetical protein
MGYKSLKVNGSTWGMKGNHCNKFNSTYTTKKFHNIRNIITVISYHVASRCC